MPDKVAWLIHQYRAAYELCGTPYSDFGHKESDVGLRDTLIALDTEMLGECRRVFTNARNTASRRRSSTGCRPSRCIIRRGSRRGCIAGPYDESTCSRSAASNR